MDASDTIYTKDEKYKMKSLKGHFAKTNILMIVISAALVIKMCIRDRKIEGKRDEMAKVLQTEEKKT